MNALHQLATRGATEGERNAARRALGLELVEPLAAPGEGTYVPVGECYRGTWEIDARGRDVSSGSSCTCTSAARPWSWAMRRARTPAGALTP
jgi:hypothetical protein